MKIFYGNSASKRDISGDSPIEASLDTALSVFRGLDSRSGFMGIILDPQLTVQFAPQEQGGIRVELLDTLRLAFDACVADAAFAESLIRTVAVGQDVFLIARASTYEWEHTDL
jgi:hypothetical protein